MDEKDLINVENAEINVEEVKPEKKKATFGKGMFIGIFSGIFIAAIVAVIAVNITQNVTGYPILLSNTGAHIFTTQTLINRDAAEKTDEIMKAIDFYYDGEYDVNKLRDDVYHSIVNGLGDKYAEYMSAEEYRAFSDTSNGIFYGIGAQLQKDTETGNVIVTKVFKDSPAEEIGLQEDDWIVSANGYKAVDYDLNTYVSYIKGEEGTTVEIEIYRPFTDELFTKTATRRKVDSPSVDYEMLTKKIGYLQVTEFKANTSAQFKAAYEALEEQGMEQLIIDLRDNPGGRLDAVTDMLDYVLPTGTTVTVTNKYGATETFKSDSACINVDMVVLVNGNSASASEIFAGAIKDYKYGTIIVAKTFGKGIVQSILPLKDGDAIKLTTAKYYTPNGNYIHEVGIEPDIELEYVKQESYTRDGDNQLQKAIEVLNNK